MDVTERTFASAVIERSHEKPVVVDFWADWCGPCKALTPVLEQEVAQRSDALELAEVDVDANQRLAAEYGIRGIPAVKAFRNGRVVSEFVGAKPPQLVAAFLDELLAPSPGERLLAELASRASGPSSSRRSTRATTRPRSSSSSPRRRAPTETGATRFGA